LACQSILELRSEEQEICYTRSSYTEIGDEIAGGEVGKRIMGKMGGTQDSGSRGHTNLLTNGLCGPAVFPTTPQPNCASRYKPYKEFLINKSEDWLGDERKTEVHQFSAEEIQAEIHVQRYLRVAISPNRA
jgi:hypothetical protein